VNVLTLLEMAATGMPDRVGIGRQQPVEAAPVGLTYRALLDRAQCGASVLAERDAEELVYVGVNADDFAVALFAAAWAATASTDPRAEPVAPPAPAIIAPRVQLDEGLRARQTLTAMAVGAVGALTFSRLTRWLR